MEDDSQQQNCHGYNLKEQRKRRSKRRKRTVITSEEMEKLEGLFSVNQKPDRFAKMELARDIGKPENFINIWFQNRRARERKMIGATAKKSLLRDDDDVTDMNDSAISPCEEHTNYNTDLFRRMVCMAASLEGGVLPTNWPGLKTSQTDAKQGVVLKDGRLFYNRDFGFEVNEIDLTC